MNGYHNKPEESKSAWDENGFLRTGDVVYYDENYCFFVVDRIKDLLKYQSWHVSPKISNSLYNFVFLPYPITYFNACRNEGH